MPGIHCTWVEQEGVRLTRVGMGTHQAQEKGRDWRGMRAGFWHSKVRDRHLGHSKKKEPRGFTDGGRCLLQDKWNQHLYKSKHYAVLESTLKRNIWWRGKLHILWTETANFSRKSKTVNTISSQPRWSLSQLLGSNYHKKQAQTVCKQECGPEFVTLVFYSTYERTFCLFGNWVLKYHLQGRRDRRTFHDLITAAGMLWMRNVSYSLTCLSIWSPVGGTVWKMVQPC